MRNGKTCRDARWQEQAPSTLIEDCYRPAGESNMNVRVLMTVSALLLTWSTATLAESGIPGHRRVIPIRGEGWWAPVDSPAVCAIIGSLATIPTASSRDPVSVPTYRCKLQDEE